MERSISRLVFIDQIIFIKISIKLVINQLFEKPGNNSQNRNRPVVGPLFSWTILKDGCNSSNLPAIRKNRMCNSLLNKIHSEFATTGIANFKKKLGIPSKPELFEVLRVYMHRLISVGNIC